MNPMIFHPLAVMADDRLRFLAVRWWSLHLRNNTRLLLSWYRP